MAKRGRWFRLNLVLIFLALLTIGLSMATRPATTKMIVPTSMNGIIDEIAQLNDTFSELLAEYQAASKGYQDYLDQNPVFFLSGKIQERGEGWISLRGTAQPLNAPLDRRYPGQVSNPSYMVIFDPVEKYVSEEYLGNYIGTHFFSHLEMGKTSTSVNVYISNPEEYLNQRGVRERLDSTREKTAELIASKHAALLDANGPSIKVYLDYAQDLVMLSSLEYSRSGEWEQKYSQQAICAYEKARMIEPQNFEMLLALANLYAGLDEKRAINYYEQILAIDERFMFSQMHKSPPTHQQARLIGIAFYNKGRFLEFLDNGPVEFGYDGEGSFYRCLSLGDEAYISGDYAEAKEHYDWAIVYLEHLEKNQPHNSQAYIKRAKVLVHLGLYDGALEDLQVASTMNPELAEAHLYRAAVFDLTGDDKQATASIRKALGQDRTLTETLLKDSVFQDIYAKYLAGLYIDLVAPLGNGVGNLMNGGQVVDTPESIYYGSSDGLYILNKGRGTWRELWSIEVWNLNWIDGGWLYFYEPNPRDDNEVAGIYRSRPNYSGRELILPGVIGDLVIVGDWIYFTQYMGERYAYRTYKVRTDGTSLSDVDFDKALNMSVVGEWIYYLNYSDPVVFHYDYEGFPPYSVEYGKLYKMRLDGSEKTKLSDDPVRTYQVEGDNIYYLNFSDGSQLYSMKTDGSGGSKVAHFGDMNFSTMNITNSWLYLANHEGVYKMELGKKELMKIYDDRISPISVIGDWIYYKNTSKELRTFRIRTDGTDNEQMSLRF